MSGLPSSGADRSLVNVDFRPIAPHELSELLALYRHLHDLDAPLPDAEIVNRVWETILQDPKLRCLVGAVDDRLIASCTLVIVPNLTRGARPYGLIENVVTHAAYRRQGVGTRLLRYALQMAWDEDCYKVMLLTGRRDEAVLRFYERAGFKRGVKTGFVATPEDGS